MTKKLYDLNAYATEFTATVLEVIPKESEYEVVLDETLFFPEEGGQSCDKGTLNDVAVKHVRIKDDLIYHVVEKDFKVGEKVKGKIDFNHRFLNMQMHSGEHIFSGLTFKKYGFNNVGFHLSDNTATIDLDGKLSREELLVLEEEVNRVIVSNVEVKAYYPSKEELEKLEYRSKKELKGPVRIVIIEGADVCACCAPHVKRTGEIGLFKIVSSESYKGGIRINYLCGFRALKDYEERITALKDIAFSLSAKAGDEALKVKELNEAYKKLDFKAVNLTIKTIENEIEKNFTGRDNGMLVLEPEMSGYMKYAMTSLHKFYKGTCFLFCGDDEKGYRYLIESKKEDLLPLSETLKKEHGAKGGGKRTSIQGNVQEKINNLTKYV